MNEPVVRLVCFELCGDAFAFNMEHLIEIVQIRPSEVTPCFTPIPFVRGTWMYRTQAIYVIDVREFFHLTDTPSSAFTPLSHEPPSSQNIEDKQMGSEHEPGHTPTEKRDKSMLVVRIRDHIFGIFSDAVLQVVPLGIFYEFPDFVSTLPRQYFAGIIRIHGALALVLAIDELMSAYEIELLAGLGQP